MSTFSYDHHEDDETGLELERRPKKASKDPDDEAGSGSGSLSGAGGSSGSKINPTPRRQSVGASEQA